MIKSFKCRNTETLFHRQPYKKLAGDIRKIARRKLLMIDAASRLDDLRVPPGNRLERLKGKRSGQHSMRINDQWRICFAWKDGDAVDVEICDYH